MQNDFLTPYKEDSGVPPYLPFPRFLVPMDLSNDAKVLYALLLDRAGISRENGYIEPDGRIIIRQLPQLIRWKKQKGNCIGAGRWRLGHFRNWNAMV